MTGRPFLGLVIWLIMDVAGMPAAAADELRRAFARPQHEQ